MIIQPLILPASIVHLGVIFQPVIHCLLIAAPKGGVSWGCVSCDSKLGGVQRSNGCCLLLSCCETGILLPHSLLAPYGYMGRLKADWEGQVICRQVQRDSNRRCSVLAAAVLALVLAALLQGL